MVAVVRSVCGGAVPVKAKTVRVFSYDDLMPPLPGDSSSPSAEVRVVDIAGPLLDPRPASTHPGARDGLVL
jgi:hypothetical protein